MRDDRYLVTQDEPVNQPNIGHTIEISEEIDGRQYSRKVWLDIPDDRFRYSEWLAEVAKLMYPDTRTPVLDSLRWVMTSALTTATVVFVGTLLPFGFSTLVTVGIVLLVTFIALLWLLANALEVPLLVFRLSLVILGFILALL